MDTNSRKEMDRKWINKWIAMDNEMDSFRNWEKRKHYLYL